MWRKAGRNVRRALTGCKRVVCQGLVAEHLNLSFGVPEVNPALH